MIGRHERAPVLDLPRSLIGTHRQGLFSICDA